MVEFRRLNFMQADWGVHARYDAIFCRNVIIYFDQELQKALVTRLAGHLSPEGCYFSGHSENLHWLGDILAPLEPTIYRLKGAAAGPGASTGARRDTPEGRGRAR